MNASIVIITRNRKDELRAAIRSASIQTTRSEIVVIDDGSSDGTSEMIRSEFPAVRMERSEVSNGYIFQRNRAASLAHGEIIFSVDDDAEFSSPNIVEQTLRDFSDRRIGAVAMPLVEGRDANQMHQLAPDSSGIWVTDRFVGTAHAVRRDVFLKLGGYGEHLLHQGEEGDYCLRMLAAGYVTRVGRADPIFHYESPDRSSERMDFYGRRNDILFTWQNVPMPYLPFHLVATIVRGSIYAVRSARHPQKMFAGMFSGLAECFRGDFERRPVNPRIYRLSRELKKRGPLPLRSVLDCLPALVED
jgi:glycosyltransferase involved in cell wall biosynthesis